MSDDPFAALSVDVEASFRMPIILPDTIEPLKDVDGNESYIAFLAWDSEEGRKLDKIQTRDNIRRGFRQRSRAELLAEAEKEDPIETQVDRLTALATGWHLVNPDKTVIDLPFSKEAARKLFANPKTAWLRRQAWTWVNNEANFMRSSSKT